MTSAEDGNNHNVEKIQSTETPSRQSVMTGTKWFALTKRNAYYGKTYHISETSTTPGIKPIVVQGLVAFSVSLYSAVVGYALAYTAPALVSMERNSSTIHPTRQEQSWIGSLMPLSALLGGCLGGLLIEFIGRKKTIMVTAPPFTASFLMIGLAQHVGVIMGGRVIAGVCVGIITLGLPVYLGETLQPEIRGIFGTFPTTLGGVGILLCFTVGYWLEWRELAYFGACLPVGPFIIMFFIPESPIWYIRNGKTKKAQNAVMMLRGKNIDVAAVLSTMYKTSQRHEKMNMSLTFKELFRKHNRWPLGICLGLMFFQQFSGINAMIFYNIRIFQDAGSTINHNLAAIIVGFVNLASTLTAALLIDRLGRKILLYVSSATMALVLSSLATFIYVKEVQCMDVSHIGWLPLAAFVLFITGFSLGAGPIPWLMMGEILPAKVRGICASIATAFNWMCTFVVTKTFIDMEAAMGAHGTFWLFGVICIGFLIFAVVAVPETRGKSLEDIERKFRGD